MVKSLTFIGQVLYFFYLVIKYGFLSLGKSLFPSQFSKSVKDDVVLITGAGSGLGRGMAVKFAELGAVIVGVDVNKRGNEETKRMVTKTGGRMHTYECDLSNREQIYLMAEKVKQEVGNVTILINNAGIVSGDELLNTPDTRIELTFKVNVLAHFWTVKAFMPGMIEQQKGHIVNIASLAGLVGSAKLVDYCSSKFAAVGMDEALKVELARFGRDYIKTTIVCPYYINTGMFNGVESKIVPILDPDYVIDSILNGVLTDTEVVILPPWITFMLTLKSMLPVVPNLYISKVFGFNTSMDEFSGRTDKTTKIA